MRASDQTAENACEIWDAVVIGAGIAGLTVAWRIQQQLPCARVLVLEGANRTGGRLQTVQFQGETTELGAGRLSSSLHVHTLRLIRDAGFCLATDVVPAASKAAKPPGAAYALGGAYTCPAAASSLAAQSRWYPLSWAERTVVRSAHLSSLWDLLRAVFRCTDRREARLFALGDYLQQRVGTSPGLRAFIQAAFGYDSAFDCWNAADALRELPYYYPPEGFSTFRPGFSSLVAALESKCRVACRTRVLALQLPDGGGGWRLQTSQGQLRARSVVVATEASTAQSLLATLVPGRARARALDLAACVLATSSMRIFVHYGLEMAGWLCSVPPQLVSSGSCRKLWHHALGDGSSVLQIYVDQPWADRWHRKAQTVAGLSAAVQRALQRLFPLLEVPLSADLLAVYWPRGSHRWRPGVDSASVHEQMRQPLPGQPLYVCGEAYSLQQGWIEGAVRTAESAARRAARFLSVPRVPNRSRDPI